MTQRSRFVALLEPFRAAVRALQTDRPQLSAAEKLVRTLLMLPPFGILVILLRASLAFGRRVTVEGHTSDGTVFECHPPDLVEFYIWVFGVWEPDLTHYIRNRLDKDHVFVDVGANIGYYSLLAARSMGAAAVAVEASPEVFSALRRSVEANSVENRVRLVQAAAAAAGGLRPIYSGPEHNTGLTTLVNRRGWSMQATVEARPLDEILTEEEVRRARIIKIDVEGAEDQVLAGMQRIIAAAPREAEILLELSPKWWSDPSKTPATVLQPFVDAGFSIYVMRNSYWPWRYLWPRSVPQPRRLRGDYDRKVRRLDLVLSRTDADVL